MGSSNGTGKKRIAIVGGGPSALVAAFHLTRNEQEAYEITIYEMSWRLGGKTVSGRGEHGRIEEHGLHILFGCYHNVFATMLECYDEFADELKIPRKVHAFQHFYDAIEPHHFGVIGDDRQERWQPILIEFPSNRGVPGDPPLPGIFELISVVMQVTWMVVFSARSLRILHRVLAPVFDFRNRWREADFAKRTRSLQQRHQRDARSLGGDVFSRAILLFAKTSLSSQTLRGKFLLVLTRLAQVLTRPLRYIAFWFFGRWWSALDFLLALVRGLIRDDVFSPGGFEKIDAHDLRGWLHLHGADEETLGSPWMRVIYDAAFSYPEGGLRPTAAEVKPGEQRGELCAAGASIRALLLMTITYKGAFYNKMRAGMGDVISLPLYLVLKKRGVKFEFFHRLSDIVPQKQPDGSYAVSELHFDTLPVDVDYDPLVSVKDLLCWPSQPKLDGMAEACHERARSAESYAPSGASRERVLKVGTDFQQVIFAAPVACIPYACPTLLAVDAQRTDALRAKPTWAEQAKIDTVQTVALQLWLKPNLAQLGWRDPSPLLSLFLDPLNTWCDMTHLEPTEAWPAPLKPGNVSYFCGALPHRHPYPAPAELGQVPALRAAIKAQVEDVSRLLLEKQLYQLLPTARGGDGFNYGLLVDERNGKDVARLAAAYQRGNYEPHELCTLALPEKTQYRMRADATGYSNLFVSGDWTDNGVYLACVEGAFQAGIRTARAVAAHTGGPVEKYGIAAEGLLNLKVSKPTAPAPKHD